MVIWAPINTEFQPNPLRPHSPSGNCAALDQASSLNIKWKQTNPTRSSISGLLYCGKSTHTAKTDTQDSAAQEKGCLCYTPHRTTRHLFVSIRPFRPCLVSWEAAVALPFQRGHVYVYFPILVFSTIIVSGFGIFPTFGRDLNEQKKSTRPPLPPSKSLGRLVAIFTPPLQISLCLCGVLLIMSLTLAQHRFLDYWRHRWKNI